MSRRAHLGPEEAGLPAYGRTRRVPGLRREEVALLAGVSIDYYTRLERGYLAGVSDAVLEALATALQLDEAERAHLHDLARAATSRPRTPRRPSRTGVRPTIRRTLDALVDAPAYVRNGRRDLLAANRLGEALYADLYAEEGRPVNLARFTFLAPRAHDFFADWARTADDLVAALRTEAGRNPYDKALAQLIGELCTRSDEFSTRWAAHHVRFHRSGTKRLHHPVVGDLELSFEALDLPADPGLSLIIYGAEPASASEDGLRLLASWAASRPPATTGPDNDLRPASPTATTATTPSDDRTR